MEINGQNLLLDGPFEVPKILVYTLSFAFAFSYQQCTICLGVLQINLYHRKSKAIWKVSNNRFPILELLFDPKEEVSWWKVDLPNLLHCKSTQLTVQLSHKGKILLNRLVLDYSPRFSEYLQLLLSLRGYIFLFQWWHTLVPYKCFYPRGCIWFNLDNYCLWVRESSYVTFSRNTKPTESAITFTNPSTDSDNTVLSSEKENCKHGTSSSFPLVGV
jgi:hypothetical protein